MSTYSGVCGPVSRRPRVAVGKDMVLLVALAALVAREALVLVVLLVVLVLVVVVVVVVVVLVLAVVVLVAVVQITEYRVQGTACDSTEYIVQSSLLSSKCTLSISSNSSFRGMATLEV